MKSLKATENFIGRNRFVWLFCALVVFYVVTPILHELHEKIHSTAPPIVEGILFLAVLLGAVASVSKERAGVTFALLLGLPTLILWLLTVFGDSTALSVSRYLLLTVFLGYVIWVMLRVIFDSRQVTFNTVGASLCIYLLIGLIWALAYSLVDVLDPAAFKNTVAASSPVRLRVGQGDTTVLYFSFATLTTLGYGDIVPTSPISRMLASTEAVTGQLYLAVLVARLVGMHIVHSMSQGPQTAVRNKAR